MLRTMILARAAKLVATCVCPVVGTGVVTMAVPQVRHAVHHYTAPREYALPKTRTRAPVIAAAAAPCPQPIPIVASPAIAAIPEITSPEIVAPPQQIALGGPGINPGEIIPIDLGPRPIAGNPGGGGGVPLPPTALPEARTWIQLVLGFGLVGGTTRMAQSRLRAAELS